MAANDRYLSKKSSNGLKSLDGSTELVPITQSFFTQFSEINSNGNGKVLATVVAVVNPDGTPISSGSGGGGSGYPASVSRTPSLSVITNTTGSTTASLKSVSFFVKTGTATVLGYVLNTGEGFTLPPINNDTYGAISYVVDSVSTLLISSVS